MCSFQDWDDFISEGIAPQNPVKLPDRKSFIISDGKGTLEKLLYLKFSIQFSSKLYKNCTRPGG